jgi:biotin transport system substrate-specific component
MRTDIISRRYPLWLIRILRIGLFTVLLAIAAKTRIVLPNTPVPITMQTLVVFLAGMVLGPVEGALSVAGYVGAIASGLPLDAYGLGPAVFVGPTAGYLIGFIPAACVAGMAWRMNGWLKLILSVVCGLAAAAIILVVGTVGVSLFQHTQWANALLVSLFPFVLTEPGKVLLAASLVKAGQESWLRWITPHASSQRRR